MNNTAANIEIIQVLNVSLIAIPLYILMLETYPIIIKIYLYIIFCIT